MADPAPVAPAWRSRVSFASRWVSATAFGALLGRLTSDANPWVVYVTFGSIFVVAIGVALVMWFWGWLDRRITESLPLSALTMTAATGIRVSLPVRQRFSPDQLRRLGTVRQRLPHAATPVRISAEANSPYYDDSGAKVGTNQRNEPIPLVLRRTALDEIIACYATSYLRSQFKSDAFTGTEDVEVVIRYALRPDAPGGL